jgi:spore maturation protein SpmA
MTTKLNALQLDRRAMLVTSTASSVLMMPTAVLAVDDYVPQLKDMQQIYCTSMLAEKITRSGGVVTMRLILLQLCVNRSLYSCKYWEYH